MTPTLLRTLLPAGILVVAFTTLSPAQAAVRCAPQSGVPVDEVDRLTASIVGLRNGKLSPAQVVTNLAPLGAGALFAALEAGEVRMQRAGRSVMAPRLTDEERAMLVEALGRSPWGEVTATLAARRASEVNLAARLAAMEILGALGHPEDLNHLLDWAELEGRTARVPAAVRSALTSRLNQLIEREPRTLQLLPHASGVVNRSLLFPILQAVTEGQSAERMATLSELLRKNTELDAHVLTEIGHMAQRSRSVPGPNVRERVRLYLTDIDPVLALEGVDAVSRLRDRDAIPALIELLRSQDATLRKRAYKALTDITGQQLSHSVDTWREWHTVTTDWWNTEAAGKIRIAVNGAPGAASKAIQELAKLRLYRDELAPQLAAGLRRDETELVLLTCATLGHLGSAAAVKPLLESLIDPNLDVRRAAFMALRRITSEDHGDDPAQWGAAGW